ncbi:hypothetical protein [Lewinella sp. JB7]|uniref:hypothetical protein n=1 Tax=Lewinella sp. JB7 TaxID=2962887 RepID=UPI0020C97340|nr:hypothetical protein [Lewinella sp. JB7]MCP9237176.1 hypothetical protein [Lewinella sp. JB7]
MSDSNPRHSIIGDPGEYTVRYGEAEPVIVAKRIHISGTITAPADWAEQKETAGYSYLPEEHHAVVDRDGGTIVFMSNDEQASPGGHTITGKLRPATALDGLHINTQRTYTAKELGALLKMNRALFADRDENMAIVTSLQKFRATVTQELEKNNDLRGNVLHHFEQRVSSEFNLTFKLTTPIYKGQPARSFGVEIRYDVCDSAVTYWLESVELKELQDTERDAIIDHEIGRLRALDVPIVEQ